MATVIFRTLLKKLSELLGGLDFYFFFAAEKTPLYEILHGSVAGRLLKTIPLG